MFVRAVSCGVNRLVGVAYICNNCSGIKNVLYSGLHIQTICTFSFKIQGKHPISHCLTYPCSTNIRRHGTEVRVDQSSKLWHDSKLVGPNSLLEKEPLILGIETSCDDTGVAIVNGSGSILGEGYFSQATTSVKLGGVLPAIAPILHEQNIKNAIHEAFEKSSLSPEKITAVATTVKPGNVRSLRVGLKYGKEFALKYDIPFIPIHHMEAHALTARMLKKIEFPFLVLLASGGHCLLVLAHSITKWTTIGETTDIAPGCAIDLIARRLKLRNIPGMDVFCSGKAVEILAQKGNPKKYEFPTPNCYLKTADFSFSGLQAPAYQLIQTLEGEKGILGGQVIEEVNDVCASFQYALVRHMIRQTHKGMRFIEYAGLMPNDHTKNLVISGGVASNQFLKSAFEKLCETEEYSLHIPPPNLCTDNGCMIAWNGVERWRSGEGILYNAKDIEEVTVQHKCPIGPYLPSNLKNLHLKNPKWVTI